IRMVQFLPKRKGEDVIATPEHRAGNISGRIRSLSNLFIILFITLSGGLVYSQVVVAQQVTANVNSTFTRHCFGDSAPMRGRILDRNGVVLAYSKPSKNPSLCGYQRVYTDPSFACLICY